MKWIEIYPVDSFNHLTNNQDLSPVVEKGDSVIHIWNNWNLNSKEGEEAPKSEATPKYPYPWTERTMYPIEKPFQEDQTKGKGQG